MTDIVSAKRKTNRSLLRRYIALILVLTASGAVAGVLWAASGQRIHTSESRLAVTGRGLTSEEIGYFPVASQELAADYARYVNNAEQQSSLERDLGVRQGSVTKVSASPIPESNVIRIEVSALDRGAAQAATRAVGEALTAQINDTTAQTEAAETALAELTTLSEQAATAQTAARASQTALDNAQGRIESGFPRRTDDFAALAAAASTATAQFNLLEAQRVAAAERYQLLITQQGTPATLEVVMRPAYQGDDFRLQALRFGLLGMAVGGALAVALVKFLDSRRKRPQTSAQQAAAADQRPASPPTAPAAAAKDDDVQPLPQGDRPLAKAGSRPK